jgi:hypothetical protein
MKMEWREHFSAAGKEFLLALGSLIQAGIDHVEDRTGEGKKN